jgi:hypothetical protein
MAKIPQNLRDKAEASAESWGQFVLLNPGLYAARLEEVDTTRPDGPAGPFWVWIFKYENQPGKAFLNTSFSEKAIGSVGAVYRAFDAPIDEDTDELIGELCILSIGVGVVKKGERKGQKRNEVSAVLPWQDGFEDQDSGSMPDLSGEMAEAAEGESSNGSTPAKAARSRKRTGNVAGGGGKAEDWE